jgi:carbonic anhydrase
MDPIDKLTAGYKVFRNGRFKEQRTTYEALVDQGQSPKVALVACSDSRVDPGIVLQADPGDLFIGTSTAVEFAVEHLEVGHIIVLGHAHCGGIRSLFDSPGESGETGDADSFVPSWMGLVRSAYLRVEGTMPEATLEEKARICEQSAVMVSLENLMTFPSVRERVAGGRLRLHGWHIDIRSCALQVYDPASQHFEPVD